MEDWIKNVETLTHKHGELLLSQFDEEDDEDEEDEYYSDEDEDEDKDEDENIPSLTNRLEEFLGRAIPNQTLLDEIQTHAIDAVLHSAISRIIQTWSAVPTKLHFQFCSYQNRILVLTQRKQVFCTRGSKNASPFKIIYYLHHLWLYYLGFGFLVSSLAHK